MPNPWNITFGTPIYSDDGLGQVPALSGGSWLYLTSLKQRELEFFTRSTNLLLASTQFDVDLGVARPIAIIAIPKHNLTLASKIRVRAYLGAGHATNVFDTGWRPGITKPQNIALKSELVGTAPWAAVNTPTLTQVWSFADDISLALVGDDSGVVTEYYQQPITFPYSDTAFGSGSVGVPGALVGLVAMKGTIAAASGWWFDIWDNTAGVSRGQFIVTWDSQNRPVVSPFSGGALLNVPSSEPKGGFGAYRIWTSVAGIVPANANFIRIGGASSAAEQGNVAVGGVMVDPTRVTIGEYVPTDAAIAGADTTGMNAGFLYVPLGLGLPSPQIARYWLIEIDDTTNPAGYIDLHRLVLAGYYQPAINMAYGAKLAFETETQRRITDGATARYNTKPRRRMIDFTLPAVPEDEGMTKLYELQRREGLSGQVMFVYDPSDEKHRHRRSFLAVQRALSALERAEHGRDNVPMSLVEEL